MYLSLSIYLSIYIYIYTYEHLPWSHQVCFKVLAKPLRESVRSRYVIAPAIFGRRTWMSCRPRFCRCPLLANIQRVAGMLPVLV